MIKLSVALPVFNSKEIVWLALESLANQICIDFEWELIVAEEVGMNDYGRENYRKFWEQRLKPLKCVRFQFLPIYNWIPLSRKWKLIGDNISDTSEIFLLQAADCYSASHRLVDTYQKMMLHGSDWYHVISGFFYDVNQDKIIVYDHEDTINPTALSMAFKSEYARTLPDIGLNKGVDTWLFNHCKKESNDFGICVTVNGFSGSLDTNGLNNISQRADYFVNPNPPFYKFDGNIDYIVPPYIAKKLRKVGKENVKKINKRKKEWDSGRPIFSFKKSTSFYSSVYNFIQLIFNKLYTKLKNI